MIAVAYLFDSIPDTCLSSLDRAYVARPKRWRPWPKSGHLSVWMGHSTAALASLVGLQELISGDLALDSEQKRRRARERRGKRLEKFLLSLSDQQLVTGLAILVASYANRCTMTMYDFTIVAALAWFSSTTHLSTLSVLRVYLIEHPTVRSIRVFSMVCFLVMLVISQVLVYSSQDSSSPVQRAFDSFWQVDENTNVDVIPTMATIAFFLTAYGNRILSLYSEDGDRTVYGLLFDMVMEKLKGSRNRRLESILIAVANKTVAERTATHRLFRQRRRFFHYYRCIETKNSRHRRLMEWMWVYEEIQNSFMSELLTLMFVASYGTTTVIVSRV